MNPGTLTADRPQAAAPAEEAAAPQYVVPFPRAADQVVKPFDDRSLSFSTSAQRQGPVSVLPMGYLRSIVILVETDGTGAGGSAVAAGDAPWNALESISLEDTAGRPIVGPISGWELYQANRRGGYLGYNDPSGYPSYSAIDSNGEFSFKLRIPVEITGRDALGALPNQTSASTFKVFYSLAAESSVYTTSPVTTTPGVRVRCFLEAWGQPKEFAPDGITPNATRPPALGTVQFWSVASYNVSAAEQRINIPRVGNHLRNLGFIYYNDSSPSVRNSTEFPADLRLEMDNKILFEKPKTIWIDEMFERYGFAADTGVFWLDFISDMDGRAGHEARNLWLPTTSGTRLDLIGTFTGAGTLKILTNDVLVRDAEIDAGV